MFKEMQMKAQPFKIDTLSKYIIQTWHQAMKTLHCRVRYSTELQMCFFSQTKIVQIQGYENVFSLFLPFNNVHLWSPFPGGRSVKKEKWISDRRDGFKKQSWTTTKIFNLEDNKGPRLLSRQRLQAWHQRWVHRGNFRCWTSASVVHHLLRVHGGGMDLRIPDGWFVYPLLRGMLNKIVFKCRELDIITVSIYVQIFNIERAMLSTIILEWNFLIDCRLSCQKFYHQDR